MSRITFRTILLVSSLVTLVLSFNLLVGAQDQPPNKQTDKTSQTAKEKSSASDANKTQDADKTQDANKAMQAGATATGMLSSDDKKFIKEAAHGGMMEVDLGKLAAQKAMSDEVKQFGQRMADDHSKANDELMQLASSKGVMINHSMGSTATSGTATAGGTDSPATASQTSTTQTSTTQTNTPQTSISQTGTMSGPGPSASSDEAKMMKKHQDMVSKMSALSGAEFDRKYMEHMVKDHEKDVAAFERISTKGTDADLKAWAAKTLPTLREHLQLARDTEAKVKASSKGSANKTP
jgi:putative membrane protein